MSAGTFRMRREAAERAAAERAASEAAMTVDELMPESEPTKAPEEPTEAPKPKLVTAATKAKPSTAPKPA